MNNAKTKAPDIVRRTLDYSRLVIKLYRELEKDSIGKILGRQLLRSATSVGANVHEAQGGQTKADFIAKMSIAYKEVIESSYWLELIKEESLIPPQMVLPVLGETKQLTKILSSILLSSKQNCIF